MMGAVRLYRWTLSPLKNALLGPAGCCRYHPTCSEYALDALHAHGPFRGFLLTFRRLTRCHPWGGAGWDPVPSPQPAQPPSSHPIPPVPSTP